MEIFVWLPEYGLIIVIMDGHVRKWMEAKPTSTTIEIRTAHPLLHAVFNMKLNDPFREFKVFTA